MSSIHNFPFQMLMHNGPHLGLPNQIQAEKWPISPVVKCIERWRGEKKTERRKLYAIIAKHITNLTALNGKY